MHSRRFLVQFSPDAMRKASQLALQIYARLPLIPRTLFLNGANVVIGDKDSEGIYNGTLASDKHKIKVLFWPIHQSIFVCCLPFLASSIGGNVLKALVSSSTHMGTFVT